MESDYKCDKIRNYFVFLEVINSLYQLI